MDDYKKLLKKAKDSMPQISKSTVRFEYPSAFVQPGKQTIIKNFSDIAKAVRRDPKHIAKFLFKELALPGNINGNELVMQGRLSSSLLNQRINDYVKEFVFCKECGKPDTVLLKTDKTFIMKCEACGARKPVSSI